MVKQRADTVPEFLISPGLSPNAITGKEWVGTTLFRTAPRHHSYLDKTMDAKGIQPRSFLDC
jgi:hypothetical protein